MSKRAIKEFAGRYPEARGPLMQWYRVSKKARWSNLIEIRRQFPSADAVPPFTVFNIGGNKYRLIAEIGFISKVVLIRHIRTHAEYDKGAWKR